MSDTLTVVYGDVLVDGGTLNVGSYIQTEGMKLVLDSNNDVKNVHVSDYFFVDDWSDIQFGSNVTVNVNTYVTGNHTVLNGPGTNYWAPSNPDTLNGTFAKGIWTENSYCYIEYPIYNVSGTVTEYRRGYVPDANVSESFGTNSYNSTTAFIENGSVYSMPSTSSQNLGTFVSRVFVTILDIEGQYCYIEYLYNGYGPVKRGYIHEDYIISANTQVDILDDTIELGIKDGQPLVAIMTPESPDENIIWTSLDTSVATVDSQGYVTAKGYGTTTIVARTQTSGATDVCRVTVEKKAILIIPGIMGSELFADQDYNKLGPGSQYYTVVNKGERLWDPAIGLNVFDKINMLTCDKRGMPIFDVKAGNENYGALSSYQTLFNYLSDQFSGSSYSVDYVPYDWRMSCMESADVIENHIERNGYDKVIFVAHSMGGVVASCYLSKGKTQRDKVELMISLGAPYLGAIELINVYCNGLELSAPLNVANLYLKPIIPNIKSVYELFPTKKWFDLTDNHFLEYTTYYTVPEYPDDGKTYVAHTYNETKEHLYRHLSNFNEYLSILAEETHNTLFVGDQHITGLVNSYYIVGTNLNTRSGVTINVTAESGLIEG